MKVLAVFFIAFCAISAVSAMYFVHPYGKSAYNYLQHKECKPGEFFYPDCSLEPICDIYAGPKTYAPVPICGCRCAPGYSRDLISGLCKPTNALGQC